MRIQPALLAALALLSGSCAAAAAAAVAVDAPTPIVQLDALGSGVRIRFAPPGGSIVNPPLSAILLPADGGQKPLATSTSSITNGNLMVTADPTTGLITATRLSDKTVVLQQTGLQWGLAAPGSRPGSVSATVNFAGGGQDERVYGAWGTLADWHELSPPSLVAPAWQV